MEHSVHLQVVQIHLTLEQDMKILQLDSPQNECNDEQGLGKHQSMHPDCL